MVVLAASKQSTPDAALAAVSRAGSAGSTAGSAARARAAGGDLETLYGDGLVERVEDGEGKEAEDEALYEQVDAMFGGNERKQEG